MVKYPNIADTDYFTNRKLENENGEETGKIVMWRVKGEQEFTYIMVCPFCKHEQEKKEAFSRRPYRPKCDKCGKSVVISKIKQKKQ